MNSGQFANMVLHKMAITFIHTADWQIGKTFGRFDPELGAQLRLARLNAIDRIAAHARAEAASHVLVGGDIWDQENPSDKTLHNTLERLSQASDVTWWLLPGNHDPARPNGLWHRLQSTQKIPANVRLLLRPEAIAINENVFVLPAPLLSKDAGCDLTEWMDACTTPEGAIRIGLAHGSVVGFGDSGEATDVIAATRAQSARLDYLALGDWHGKKQIGDRTWYSGTPEPDQFPRNEPGWCLSVTIERAGALPKVVPLETLEFTWLKADVAVSPGMAPRDIFSGALQGTASAQKTLLQVTLQGHLQAEAAAALRNEIANRQDALAYLQVRQTDLKTLIETADLDRLDHAGSLRAAGEDLLARSQDKTGSQDEQHDARNALALLFAFAADGSREAGP